MWEAAREIFGRTLNGCGHRQIGMCLRAEHDVRITNKTVLKMMREMGLRCLIRRKKKPGAYSSYKGDVGKIFPNKLNRDFSAERPMEKLGTDVTEFRQSWGKAYLALVSDFYTKEIVAYAVSEHPDLAQQGELLGMLFPRVPAGEHPVLHSDMGWQYQHIFYQQRLADNGMEQSMSRKGNCLDNAATEQVFGHLKDEFFRGLDTPSFPVFKENLASYVVHWNTRRRQVKLKGLTPEEFRNQYLRMNGAG